MKALIVTALLSLLVGITGGYYLFGNDPLPQNVVSKDKTKTTIIKKQIVTKSPDGTVTKETETKTEEKKDTDTQVATDSRKNNKLSLLVLSDFTAKQPVYGVGYERRLLGPWFVGAFAVPVTKEIGLTLSLEF